MDVGERIKLTVGVRGHKEDGEASGVKIVIYPRLSENFREALIIGSNDLQRLQADIRYLSRTVVIPNQTTEEWRRHISPHLEVHKKHTFKD